MAGRLGPRHSEKDNEAGMTAAQKRAAAQSRAQVALNAKTAHSTRTQYGNPKGR